MVVAAPVMASGQGRTRTENSLMRKAPMRPPHGKQSTKPERMRTEVGAGRTKPSFCDELVGAFPVVMTPDSVSLLKDIL